MTFLTSTTINEVFILIPVLVNLDKSFKKNKRESCHEPIERIEQALKGDVFICNHDMDSKNRSSNWDTFQGQQPDTSQKKLCGRSYLSQRDLNAHI